MVIAVDINDVIRDTTRAFIKNYKKLINPYFDINYDDIDSWDYRQIFPFTNEEGEYDERFYNKFKFEDAAFEIHCRADLMERNLIAKVNLWLNTTLRDFDPEKNPKVILFSPFEMGLTIPSTLGFASRVGLQFREIEFPIDSRKMWDKCDIMITANPNLIQNKPEGKKVFKIEAPYNKDVKADYTFEGISDLIEDSEKTLQKIIEND